MSTPNADLILAVTAAAVKASRVGLDVTFTDGSGVILDYSYGGGRSRRSQRYSVEMYGPDDQPCGVRYHRTFGEAKAALLRYAAIIDSKEA